MKHTIHKLHTKFRERGFRFTVPRRAIYEVMKNTSKHLSAEEIYLKVHQNYPRIGLTTVYRNLEVMERMGVVAKSHFGDGRHRYELIQSSQKPDHHHHLVCTGCKRVIDYDDFVDEEVKLLKKVEQALAQKYSYIISGHIIQFYGLCKACNKK
jgi:Fur family transcriptional regulator, ferric uptake regulator